LISIATYSEREWGPELKRKYLDRIARRLQSVRSNPRLGRLRSDVKAGLFSVLCGSHIVFYTATDHELNVIRIMHQRMDVRGYFD
jgi:toxin ParE1/3/4